VDQCSVLHIRAGTDANRLDVAADDGVELDAALASDRHVTNHVRACRDEGALVDPWLFPVVRTYHGQVPMRHRPEKCGVRFSRIAETPSCASSVAKVMDCCRDS